MYGCRLNYGVKIIAALLVFLMVFPGLQGMIPQARADTALVQETDKDFKNGNLGPTMAVNGTGHDAAILLAKKVDWGKAMPSSNPGLQYQPPFAYDTDNGLALLVTVIPTRPGPTTPPTRHGPT